MWAYDLTRKRKGSTLVVFRLPHELAREVDSIAKQLGVTRSSLIRAAVYNHVNSLKSRGRNDGAR